MSGRIPLFLSALGVLILQMAGCSDLTGPRDASIEANVHDSEVHDVHKADPVTVVTGQNDASLDVPAVQDAVDAGGDVVLHGTFSFEGVYHEAPFGTFRTHVVLVTNDVTIRGVEASIIGGGVVAKGGLQAAFLVNAPGAKITFESVRFVSPVSTAIRVLEAGDLSVVDCEVDGVIPTVVGLDESSFAGAFGLHVIGGPFGALVIQNNRFRIGGTEGEITFGIVIGGQARASRAAIIGNQINQTTAAAIHVANVDAPTLIEGNVAMTGPASSSSKGFGHTLLILGSGDYRVNRNEFECAAANCAVVRVAATTSAIVHKNKIVSSVAESEVPGTESAGIQVRGTATGNEISVNQIFGRGRVAISVIHSDLFPVGNPSNNAFTANAIQPFEATVATIEIGEGVVDTEIIGGSGTLIDEGTNTVTRGNFRPPD